MNIQKEYKTNCLGHELILALDWNGYLIGSRTEEGGSYPLLDSELDTIFINHAIRREGRSYQHLYKK